MNYNKFRFIALFLKIILVYLISSQCLRAQTRVQKIDIDKNLPAEIYKNPDNVITKSNRLLKQKEFENDYTIKIYMLLSSAYAAKRDYEKSLFYINKASQLTNKSNDELLKISLVSKTGILYHQLKIYDKALQNLDLAEQMMANYPVKDSIHLLLGKSYIVRGFIYKDKLSCDIAVDFFKKGAYELKLSKSPLANAPLSISKYNEANCYLFMLDDKLAMQNFQESLSYAKSVNAFSLQAFALKGIAKVYTFQEHYNQAIATLTEALAISTETSDLVLKNELYKGLSENYLALNDLDKFNIYNTKYEEIKNIIKSSERKSISQSLDSKEKKLEDNLKNSTHKFYFIYAFIIGFMILSSFIFLIIIKKNKKKLQLL